MLNASPCSTEGRSVQNEDNVSQRDCVFVGSVCDLGFSTESSCSKEFSRALRELRGVTRKLKVTHLFFQKVVHTHEHISNITCCGVSVRETHLLLTHDVVDDAET